jgi:putative hydrolase of the HAD superfamily
VATADPPPVRAVLLDFYGTLGESDWVEHWFHQVVAERGYELDRDADRRWAIEAWDGREHGEHSADEAAYNRWERERWREVLVASDVAEADLVALLADVDERRRRFRMRVYDEVPGVLAELRARGLRLGICSNWDWDLDRHLEDAGIAHLVDARVSSAWVGCRKPHPRIYRAALEALGATAAETVFVGDNWASDVQGPLAHGMRAVHVWRHERAPSWVMEPPPAGDVPRIDDLTGLLDLLPAPRRGAQGGGGRTRSSP